MGVRGGSEQCAGLALWGNGPNPPGETAATCSFREPRHPSLGVRLLAEQRFTAGIATATNGAAAAPQAYHAHRIALGVPEGGKDYDLGDAYPHEADFDRYDGVSFKKGCYVGQEVVSRMQHKTVVRKRVVRIEGESALTSGSEVTHNGMVFGRVGSVDGRKGLALLKLDRYAEAFAAGDTVMAGATPIHVHDADIERYRASVQVRERKS